MSALLEARGLRLSLAGRRILDEVSLSVAPGEFIALVGPNGAGKTSFLRCCAGLAKPESGSVRIAGEPHGRGADRRRPRLSYLPQGGVLHWDLSVRDVVALGRGRFGERSDRAVDAAMEACRVFELADRSAGALSGGELARTLLARALAVEAPLLLADEPVASLDPPHQVEVMKVLAAQAHAGSAVMAVLHDLGLACTHASRIVVMRSGRILADAAPQAVLSSGVLQKAFGAAFVSVESAGATMVAVAGKA